VTYAQAGVSVDRGDEFVEYIKPLAKQTLRSGSVSGIGGFGGLFDLKAVGYSDPVLVSGTDGVGTKLKVAQAARLHSTIGFFPFPPFPHSFPFPHFPFPWLNFPCPGIDLVAMSVNDLVVQGAEPLFFLDYLATGRLDLKISCEVVKGVVDACIESKCQLLGGETAEMPGLYQGGFFFIP